MSKQPLGNKSYHSDTEILDARRYYEDTRLEMLRGQKKSVADFSAVQHKNHYHSNSYSIWVKASLT